VLRGIHVSRVLKDVESDEWLARYWGEFVSEQDKIYRDEKKFLVIARKTIIGDDSRYAGQHGGLSFPTVLDIS
jgi:hypothetical protein